MTQPPATLWLIGLEAGSAQRLVLALASRDQGLRILSIPATLVAMGDWTFEDTYMARKLKHFRARSLRSANSGDGDMLQRMVQRGHVWPSWQSDSPLRPDLDEVEKHLDVWRRARRSKDQEAAAEAWAEALRAIDSALDRAAELSGRHIRSRPL